MDNLHSRLEDSLLHVIAEYDTLDRAIKGSVAFFESGRGAPFAHHHRVLVEILLRDHVQDVVARRLVRSFLKSEAPSIDGSHIEAEALLRERAKASGCYWYSERNIELMLEVAEAHLAFDGPRWVRRHYRPRRKAIPLPFEAILEGEETFRVSADHFFTDHITTNAGRILSKEELAARCPEFRLKFLDEIPRGEGNRQQEARRSEGFTHRNMVSSMERQLRRLNWDVYPGDVGLDGVYSMADLVAIDGDRKLFVECLTDFAISRGKHINKLKLAERVPYLFVGNLPDGFDRLLPSDCWSIQNPGSTHTSRGELCPPHYRVNTHEPVSALATLIKGRKRTTLRLKPVGLRIDEDFVELLLVSVLKASLKGALRVRWRGGAPSLPYVGSRGRTNIVIEGDNVSRVVLRLQPQGVCGEIYGDLWLWQQCITALGRAGLEINSPN